jgi:hypothetical protein
MRSFSASDYLMLWEQGAGLHAIDRALLVLRCALPEADYESLVRLPLGRRDRFLMEVRQRNFGDRIDAHTACSDCGERVEFSLSCSVLLGETGAVEPVTKRITLDGVEFGLRCPDSADLAAMVSSTSVEAGEKVLLARCVDHGANSAALTPVRRAAIAAALSVLDPAAEILLDLSCPACGNSWQALFDINQVLWLEIRARARRLLQEVDALARVYHWGETEILGMSAARRGLYLEMALS